MTTPTPEPKVLETYKLKIGRREFVVEKFAATHDLYAPFKYHLKGPRGAYYGTMRNANNVNLMFVINLRGFGISSTLDGVWLTDKNGTLEVL